MPAAPQIKTFALGDYATNCFVVTVPPSRACWIVDCGKNPEPLLRWIDERNLVPEALLLTHAHFDHIAGVVVATARFPGLEVAIHEAEAGFCPEPMLNLSAGVGLAISIAEPQRHLRDGETLELAGATFRVVHAPGHSPGGALFVHDASAQAIVGDTLMAGSIGRTDFPTSDPEAFRHTLMEVILGLPDRTTIHPGHGPATTIGRERATNPFILYGF